MKLNSRRVALATVAVLAVSGVTGGVAAAGEDGSERGRERGRPDCSSTSKRGRGGSLDVVGLTADGRLICFNEYEPSDARSIGRVVGLTGDSALVGIDYRPASGELVGLGDAGGVYSIDTTSGSATKKSQLSVTLTGTSFGVDFNPTVDRLRITSNTGQNLRANVDTGATLVDTTLNYTAGTPASGVVGSAYTNNDADPNTATTLYDIDSTLDQVAIQAPPNAGSLNPTGKLGVDTSTTAEIDIYSTIRNGTTVDVTAYAALTVGGQSGFYNIALFSGKASSRGAFEARNQVTGIAVPLNQL